MRPNQQMTARNARSIRITEKRRASFLETLAEGLSVTGACRASGFPVRTAYDHRERDEKFAAEWDAAIESGTDLLEDEARRRAFVGWEEPVYQGGKLVGTKLKHSETLLIFLLNGRRPDKFKHRSELTGKNGAPIVFRLSKDDENLL